MQQIKVNHTKQSQPSRQARPSKREIRAMSNQALSELASSSEIQANARPVDLPDALRSKMENAFGADLSQMQLYESQAVADAGAEAVAQGQRITFAPGSLDLTSVHGQELLGHELAHVTARARGQVSGSGFLDHAGLEARADHEGAMAAAGQVVAQGPMLSAESIASAAGPMQAKHEDEENWWSRIKKGAGDLWEGTENGVSGAWGMLKECLSNGGSSIKSGAREALQLLGTGILSGGNKIGNKFAGSRMGQYMMEHGIEGTIGNAANWITSRPAAIGNAISNSRIARGMTWMGDWMADARQTIRESGLGQGAARLNDAVAQSGLVQGVNGIGNAISGVGSAIANSAFGQGIGWAGGKLMDFGNWIGHGVMGLGEKMANKVGGWIGAGKKALVNTAASYQRRLHRQSDNHIKAMQSVDGGPSLLDQMSPWDRAFYTLTNLPGILESHTVHGQKGFEQRQQQEADDMERVRQLRQAEALKAPEQDHIGPAVYDPSDYSGLALKVAGLVPGVSAVRAGFDAVRGIQKAFDNDQKWRDAVNERARYLQEEGASAARNDTLVNALNWSARSSKIRQKEGIYQTVNSVFDMATNSINLATKFVDNKSTNNKLSWSKWGTKVGGKIVGAILSPSSDRKQAMDDMSAQVLAPGLDLDAIHGRVYKDLEWNKTGGRDTKLSDLEKIELEHRAKWIVNQAIAGDGVRTRREAEMQSIGMFADQMQTAAQDDAVRQSMINAGFRFDENGQLDRGSAYEHLSARATGNGYESDHQDIARHREEKYNPALATVKRMERDKQEEQSPTEDKPGFFARLWKELKRYK